MQGLNEKESRNNINDNLINLANESIVSIQLHIYEH